MAEKKKPRIPVYFLTGLLLAVLCSAVIIAALTAPYERVKTYLNILFMDQKKITPSTGVNGLVITENENIPTEADGTQAQTELLESGEIIRPSFGEQYAVLNIESAGINAPVYWGSSTELLERGACQTTSSVVIGEEGNV
ncbi:MAG: class D sortase, partial [Oscillospiraceae bacterium]|nr:class D sortase [Oscillospiraceae bacterium]